jgi:Ni,Fe-hydrogenase III small subunit
MIKDLFTRILRTGRVTETPERSSPPLMPTKDQQALAFRSGSVHLRHLDAGSCNGCEIEIGACFSPIYDLEQFGIAMTPSPRHADGVLITGVVTKNMLRPFRQTLAATPSPKRLIAIGDCAIDGGPFLTSYAVEGVPTDLAPIDIAVPGCPPDPRAIIEALRQLSGK